MIFMLKNFLKIKIQEMQRNIERKIMASETLAYPLISW